LTAKASDTLAIYDNFKPLGIKEMIFTKLDETDTYGSLLNIIYQGKVNIAYITNGQNVPDDLLLPNEKILTDMLLRRYKYD